MADQRALDAVARIERALARIEAAAARPAPPDRSSELAAANAAHDRLKNRVSDALRELDTLIAAGERG